jgi:hypothetical protein
MDSELHQPARGDLAFRQSHAWATVQVATQ